MRILYVEDEQAYARRLHAEWLSDHSMRWDLAAATRLESALKRLTEEPFDALVLDLMLTNGRDLASCAAVWTATASTPIVILARVGKDQKAIQAVSLGAQDYLFRDELSGELLMRRVQFAIERHWWAIRHQQLRSVQQAPQVSLPLQAGSEGVETPLAETPVAETPVVAHHQPDSKGLEHPDGIAEADRPDRPIRFLIVDQDRADVRWMREQLSDLPSFSFQLEQQETLSAALEYLGWHTVDAILLNLSLADCSGLETLHALSPHVGTAPILVLADQDDEAVAVNAIQQGAQDFLVKSKLRMDGLVRSIGMAVERQRRLEAGQGPAGLPGSNSAVGQLGPAGGSSVELRESPRYCLTKPIYTIPVISGQLPDLEGYAEGMLVDVSRGGLCFEIPVNVEASSKRLVVGLETSQGENHFAMVEVRHVRPEYGRVRIGARFAPPERDLFSEANLLPQLDPQTWRFARGASAETLNQWAKLGVLRPILFDRAYLCPKCRALPRARSGCPSCGSGRLNSCPLIHHFACAHVSFVTDFEQNGEIVCPKCRTRQLVVGADFEHLQGAYRCLDCQWSGTDLCQVGHCLGCGNRFPFDRAKEEDLIGYHVNRLDPTALVNHS